MSARDRRLALGIALLASLLLAPGIFVGLAPSGGKAVGGACRVLEGEVPYRDFWSMYAPGQFYAVAALFAAFGRELWVAAAAAVAVRAASAGLVFLLARRLGAGAGVAAALALALAVSWFEAGPELSSYPPALLAMLAALLLVAGYLREGGGARLLGAGALLGVAALFKHDVAGYLWIGTAAGLALGWWAAGERRPRAWIGPAGAALRLAAGSAAVLAPVAALLAWTAGADAWRDLIAFPLGDFRLVRSEPYPPLWPRLGPLAAWLEEPGSLARARDGIGHVGSYILANLPQLVFALGAVFLVRRRRRMAPERLAAGCVLLASLPLFWSAAHVQQNTHLDSMALFSLLLGALAWAELGPRARAWRGALAALAAVYALGLVAGIAKGAYQVAYAARHGVALGLPGTAGVVVPPEQASYYRPIAELVRRHVPPGEPIHVGVLRHDAVVITNQRFYFLCDRPPATRYNELHPGVTDREDVQREMIADIEAAGVRCVVLWRFGWPDEVLDRITRRRMERVEGTGSQLLDRWIAERYETVLERGEYALLWRRDLPAPEVF